MKPLFFGNDDKRLYGAYHPATRSSSPGRAALLCYPIGHEYYKTQRAFRLLAERLGRTGVHVFRFDYYATGDSSGAGAEGDVETWLEDIELAARELRTLSLIGPISLVGLRFGATLAACAATRDSEISQLVLWDPIPDAAVYLDELRAIAERDDGRSDGEPDGTMSVVGVPVSSRLQAHIRTLRLDDLLPSVRAEVLVVGSHESAIESVQASLRAGGQLLASEVLPDHGGWDRLNQEPFVPQRALQWIVKQLGGTDAR